MRFGLSTLRRKGIFFCLFVLDANYNNKLQLNNFTHQKRRFRAHISGDFQMRLDAVTQK